MNTHPCWKQWTAMASASRNNLGGWEDSDWDVSELQRNGINARMGRVYRDWTKSGGRLLFRGQGFSEWASFRTSSALPGGMTFWVALFTASDPQGSSRADILTRPSKQRQLIRCWRSNGDCPDRNISRCRYHGN